MGYLWQNKDWPNFTYDNKAVSQAYEKYLYMRGTGDALFSTLSEGAARIAVTQALSHEVVSSSEIEGVTFQYDAVFSSVARHLGIDCKSSKKNDRNVESVSNLILDSLENHEAMTSQRLLHWHELLFEGVPSLMAPKDVGSYRKGPVFVVRTKGKQEQIIFEGVKSENVDEQMERLLSFIQSDSVRNPLIKSAIVSLWFVTIHPFGDGNGRLSRALADYVLFSGKGDNLHYFSVSRTIAKKRNEYYENLQLVQNSGTMDITSWIVWFIDTVTQSIEETCLSFKERLKVSALMNSLDPNEFNSRQLFMIYRLVDGSFFGKLTAEKWVKMTKCQASTATRDLSDLVEKKVLIRLGGSGKNYQYILNPEYLI